MPPLIYSNASGDRRIWINGPPSPNPLNWHAHRYALGYHLLHHPKSPFDDKAAQKSVEKCNVILQRMQTSSPGNGGSTGTSDLFLQPFTMAELDHECKILPPDKSPGPCGTTNRMLKASGPAFRELLLDFFNTLWSHDTHPQAWQKSLLQPIHKGKDAKGQEKDRLDPASYRGIYLSSAVAKLYEGLLIARITQYTEKHNTLTDNQIGTRPRRQIHDAIYSLLSVTVSNTTGIVETSQLM